MRIVIVTSCTGEKSVEHPRGLTLADFRRGAQHVARRERELADLLTHAGDLYSGQQHVRLMRGVRALRESRAFAVDLWILSAGYGVVPASRKLAPYEATFQGMKSTDLRRWADALNVPADVRRVLTGGYDLALVLLGDEYLKACALGADVRLGGLTLVFCGANTAKRLPRVANLRPIVLSTPEAKRFSCGLVGLKGEVGSRLLRRLTETPTLVEQLRDPAADVLALIDAEQAAKARKRVFRANPKVDCVIDIPQAWWDKPHRQKLRYFIPEWDDLVDPDYNFDTDTHSGGLADWSNEVYAHQLYSEPNYDGILVSKVVAEKSKKKKERINALGVHRYLRVPRDFPIMGDCGAFGYIHEEVPPYTTDEILDYYTRLDFDYGVSIDHLIVTSTEAQKKQRYELTIHNAEEFLKEHRKRRLPWTPIGAVQGWDAKSYADAARKCVGMGYKYIGLGGLVRSSTAEILRVLDAVHMVTPDQVKLHLFGLARIRALAAFQSLGVCSVDSASYLRQAWMRTAQSYVLETGAYAALRIPEAGKSFRAKRMTEHIDRARVMLLEKEALQSVRELAQGRCGIDACLNALLEYDRYVTSDRVDMAQLYRRTLTERPWERCRCRLCKQSGVEIMIFRGNNRNRRRGFHNTHVFFLLLQRVLAGENLDVLASDGASQLRLFTATAENAL